MKNKLTRELTDETTARVLRAYVEMEVAEEMAKDLEELQKLVDKFFEENPEDLK